MFLDSWRTSFGFPLKDPFSVESTENFRAVKVLIHGEYEIEACEVQSNFFESPINSNIEIWNMRKVEPAFGIERGGR